MEEQVQYTQTKEERFSILLDFFNNDFLVKFPHLERIYSPDGKTTLCPLSHVALSAVLKAEPTLKKGLLANLIAELDLHRLLVRKPQVVEKIVEVERQPTAAEIARAKKEKFEREHADGFHNSPKNNRTELDRGSEFDKPLLTEPEKAAINARNSKIDEVLVETMSAISRYTGPSHARTYSRRDELTALFNQHKNKVTDVASAEKLQRTINEKIDNYDRASSGSIR